MEHFIRYYERILTPELCAETIRRFDASPQAEPGRVLKSGSQTAVDPSVKQTTELIISGDPAWADVENAMQEGFVACVNRYAEEFPDIQRMAGGLSSEPFRLKKYDCGGFFDWHIDSGGENQKRVIAVQFYLNDVHEGGGTEFKHQQVTIDSVQGRVAIFPTLWTYLHRGAPVISNPKYICTNFVTIESS